MVLQYHGKLINPKELSEDLVTKWFLECWLNKLGDHLPDKKQTDKLTEIIKEVLENV